jgi:flagellar basal-body rod modification protein FlgD
VSGATSPAIAAAAAAASTGTSTGTSNASTTGTTTGTTGSSSSITSKVPGGLLDREAFLKLLVTQLRYQDPSKPLDSAEMISQSAQLSVVDKLQEIADLIESTGPSNRFAVGGALIGKQITFTGPDGSPQTAVASSISFDGPTMVVRAGSFDVPVDAIRSVTAVSVGGAAAS